MKEIQTVKKALEILQLFTTKRTEIGVTEASLQLSLSKATVARLMHTLKENGFLNKSDESGKYRLGWKIPALGAVFISSLEIREIALPFMKELNARLNETVDIYVLNGSSRICIERLESSYDLRPMGAVGRQAPLHAGAAGKLLLAYMPDDKRGDFLKQEELPRYTSYTIQNREELRKEVEKIRQQGYAISFQERMELVNSVAAPIRDHFGKVVASLGVSGLVTSFKSERMRQTIIPATLETAAQISRQLGYDNLYK